VAVEEPSTTSQATFERIYELRFVRNEASEHCRYFAKTDKFEDGMRGAGVVSGASGDRRIQGGEASMLVD
jgi:hypothetical protein